MNRELDTNTTLSHYRILKKLGAGGMGEVYLAQDTKLGRKVALKILPPEFAADKERMSRFVREAKSASALNHPNIITIYEISESEGTHFIATEFIEGRTLSEYAKTGRLDVKDILDIAVQIASALAEAHRAGIVHRDIKPDNIMVRPSGLAKILDFGIAKLSAPTVTDAEAATAINAQTQAGLIIGTASYMSPEQAAGKAVDARSDIFSFGVLLYEMFAGHLPFAGETVMETIGAILHTEPQPFGAKVPDEIKTVVGKTLRKNRDERYQTIAEVCRDLREIKQELEFREKLERTAVPNRTEAATQILQAKTTAETESQNSIAVLPFTNISNDEENEYFCDGLAEELLNALAKIDDLKVAARTSAFSFKGKNAEAREIGERLNVKTVLEGSVRRAGNRLRISVQLVNAADGFHLWSERYDRELKDIFDVQDEITLAVVDALKVKLFGDERAEVFERKPNSPDALDLYLKGRFHFQQHTPEGFEKAVEYFERAVERDPHYALAFAGLSSVLIFQWFFGFVSAGEAIPKARNAARRALEIKPNLDEAHIALAHIWMFYERDLKKAEREYGEAIRLNPNNAYARYQYGLCLAVLGKREQAIAEAEKSIELEPLSVLANFQVAAIYYQLGLYQESARYSQRLIEMAPDFYGGYLLKGVGLTARGEFVEAIRTFEKALTLDPTQDFTKSALGQAYGLAGDTNRASGLIKDLQNEREKRWVNAFDIARIYSGLRDVEKTLAWLEKALAEQNGELVYLKLYANQQGDVWGESLRSDKRFQGLLRRLYLSTDEPNQSDESRKAIAYSGLRNEDFESKAEPTIRPRSATRNPKSTWRLFGSLGLLLLVGGFFGYQYLTPAKQIESIAVMPFSNESGDKDVEYLSDGMTETLINNLSQIPNLNIKARSSVFRYKGKEADPQKIAAELNVQAILTGRLVQRDDRLTLNLELIDARTENTLWGNKYERKSSELVALQSEVARDVSSKLKRKLSGAETLKVEKNYTTNAEAYQLYLKGKFYWNKRTGAALKQAVEFYNQAIEKDPTYALAYSGLAETYALFSSYDVAPATDSMPQAKAAALRALELDEQLAEAHTALGFYLANYEWDRAGSEREYRRAIELNPNYATAHHWFGTDLINVKRFNDSLAELRRAEELDPLSPIIGTNLGDVLVHSRRYDEAITQYRRVLVRDPYFAYAHRALGWAYGSKGMYPEAIAETRASMELREGSSAKGYLGLWLARSGKRDEALKLLGELKQESAREYVQSYTFALIYVGLGEKEEALNYLEKHMMSHAETANTYNSVPELDGLRSEPRFKEMLKRMNLPE